MVKSATSVRPSVVDLGDGYKLRVVRGPNDLGQWYFKVARWEHGKDVAVGCFWSATQDAGQHARALLVSEPAGPVSEVSKLLHKWYESAAFSQHRKPTQVQYKTNGKHLEAMFTTYPTWEAVGKALPTVDKAPHTKRGILTCGGSLHKWARAEGLTNGPSPFSGHGVPNKGLKVKRTPTQEDASKVLGVLKGWHALALLLFSETGCRIGEVGRMSLDAVNWDKGTMDIEGKAGRPRTIRLSPAALEALKATGRTTGRVLPVKHVACPEFYRALRNACESLGLPHYTPHSYRRLLINQWRKAGQLAQVTAKYVGNSPLVLMRDYESIEQEELDAAADLVFKSR